MTFAQRLLLLHVNGESRWDMTVVGSRFNEETGEEDAIVIVRPHQGESVRYRVQGDKFRFDME